MILIDDILLSPVHGLFWVFRKINDTIQEEYANEDDRIKQELSELYMMLETGAINEKEFDAQEELLLDRLEAIQERDEEHDGHATDTD